MAGKKSKSKMIAYQALEQNRHRVDEMERFARIAYAEVPTQEEMLNGGLPLAQAKPGRKADLEITQEFEEMLSEAAQQGNIGGD